MPDKLIPIKPQPGLFKNGTRSQAMNRWYDANLVRFFDDTIRPVGGWRRVQSDSSTDFITLLGIPRAAIAYRTDAQGVIQAVGTTSKLYAVVGGLLRDITPSDYVVGRADTVYTTANGAYGSGPYGTGPYGYGSQTALLSLADTWQLAAFGNSLVAVPTSNKKLYVWAGDPAVLPVTTLAGPPTTPSATAVAAGGTFTAGTYYWKITAFGPLGESLGSTEVSATIVLNGSCNLAWVNPAGTTSVRVYRGTAAGQESVYFALGAVTTFTDTGAAGTTGTVPTVTAPTSVQGAVVTPERFLFALGAGGNARQVQWPSQETTTVWAPSATNTAGSVTLTTNGRIICGAASRGATLIWTDSDLHTAEYIGGVFVYSFKRVGENCGILSPGARVMVDGQALWMGRNGFFRYDGYVRQLESEVQDYVFSDFNAVQAEKVWGISVSEFGEVWWFYPSASSSEIDRYVVYNYVENHWTVGKLARTAGYSAGAVAKPVMVDAAGVLYEHEVLNEKVSITPLLANGVYVANGTRIANGELGRVTEVPYLESGPMELGDGDYVMRVQRVVPDAKTTADLNMKLYGAFDPTSAERTFGPYTLAQPTPVQVTARQVRVRFEEVNQVGWRIGAVKLGVRQSSRR